MNSTQSYLAEMQDKMHWINKHMPFPKVYMMAMNICPQILDLASTSLPKVLVFSAHFLYEPVDMFIFELIIFAQNIFFMCNLYEEVLQIKLFPYWGKVQVSHPLPSLSCLKLEKPRWKVTWEHGFTAVRNVERQCKQTLGETELEVEDNNMCGMGGWGYFHQTHDLFVNTAVVTEK